MHDASLESNIYTIIQVSIFTVVIAVYTLTCTVSTTMSATPQPGRYRGKSEYEMSKCPHIILTDFGLGELQ